MAEVKLNHLKKVYDGNVTAVYDFDIDIKDGEFIGLIGHTGSGKSTLTQHLNGLIKATSGGIYYNGQDIYDKDYNI